MCWNDSPFIPIVQPVSLVQFIITLHIVHAQLVIVIANNISLKTKPEWIEFWCGAIWQKQIWRYLNESAKKGWSISSMAHRANIACCTPGKFSLIPDTYILEKENWILLTLHVCYGIHTHTITKRNALTNTKTCKPCNLILRKEKKTCTSFILWHMLYINNSIKFEDFSVLHNWKGQMYLKVT